jgi:hypothetical protein
MALVPDSPLAQREPMQHIDALIGIVVLMTVSLWIISRAHGDDPFIALHGGVRAVDRHLHPEQRVPGAGGQEDDNVRWRWGGGHPM